MLRSPFQSPCRPYEYPVYEHVSLPQIELFSTNVAYSMNQIAPPPPDAWMLLPRPIDYQEPCSLNDNGAAALPKLSFEINESGRAQISSNELEPELTIPKEYLGWDLSGKILDLSSSPCRHEPAVLSYLKEFPKLDKPESPIVPPPPLPQSQSRQIDENQAYDGSECVYQSSELNSDFEPLETWNRDAKPKVLKSVDQLERLVRRGVKRARAAQGVQALDSSQVSTDSSVLEGAELKPVHIDEVNGLFNGMKTRKEAIEIMQPKALRGSLRCSAECSETFDSYVGLAEHLDKHHDNKARPYLCPVPNCPWSVLGFRFHNECKRHVTCAHTGPELRCVLCNSTFKRADALRRHLATRHLSKKVKPKRNKRNSRGPNKR